jgi:hypothetical protein
MKTSFIVFISFFTFNTFSQDLQNDVTKKNNGLTVSSYSLNMKPMNINNYVSDFYNLIKRIHPFEVPSDLSSKDYTFLVSNARLFNYNIELGLSSKPNREFLIGISYISGDRTNFNLTKKTIKRFDTIDVQGITIYADSFTYSNYNYSEYIDELGLVLANIYKSDQNKKLSVFAGYGINISYSFSSYLSTDMVHDTIYRLSNDIDPNEYLNNYKPDHMAYQTAGGGGGKTDPNFFIRAYIPLGFNWNISKENDFWKHINILFLAQFGLEFRRISSEISYFRPYWGIGGLGFKYTF